MSNGCSLCLDGRSCNNWHLYVIELDRKKVFKDEPSFPFVGELPDTKSVYYVGATRHTIECRYTQHVKRKRTNFSCACFSKTPVLRPLKKRGKYTQHHLPGGLRPEMTLHMNPILTLPKETYPGIMDELWTRVDAMEAAYADLLRLEGHAVHQN